MRLILPYPPSLNHLYATVRGRRVLSREGREYKAAVARLISAGCLSGPLVVELDVFRPRRAGDLDNVLKCLMDSLTGVAWEDDGQVVELHARRHEDKSRPRVEVVIEARGMKIAPAEGTYDGVGLLATWSEGLGSHPIPSTRLTRGVPTPAVYRKAKP